MTDSSFIKSLRPVEFLGFDLDRAEKLQKLALMADQKGDRETSLKALKAMKVIKDSADAVRSMSTRERLEVLDQMTVSSNPEIDPESDEFVFRGLDEKTVKDIKSKIKKPAKGPRAPMTMYGMAPPAPEGPSELEQKTRMANLERVKRINPHLAKIVDEMDLSDRLVTGAAAGVDTLLKGVGIRDFDADEQFYKEYLTQRSPAAAFSKAAAIATPFAAAGIALPALAGAAAPLVGLSTQAGVTLGGLAVGTGEGFVVAKGEGKDAATGAAIGAIGGVLGEAAVPVLRSAASKLFARLKKPPMKVVTDAGEVTPKFQKFLDDHGVSVEDLLQESQEKAGKELVTSSMSPSVQRGVSVGKGQGVTERAEQGLRDLADLTEASPSRIRAAEELDLDVPSAVLSENEQVQGIAGVLSTVPTSAEFQQIKSFAEKLGMKADDVIAEMGGGVDKLAVSDQLQSRMNATWDTLMSEERAAYDAVADAIDPTVKVDPRDLTDALRAEARKFRKGLEGPKKRILDVLEPETKKIAGLAGETKTVPTNLPTYAEIDRERKWIGEALGRNPSGPYKDQSQHDLGYLYSALTDLQEKAALEQGADELWNGAKALTRERKGLEDSTQVLFGRDLNDALVPKMEQALKGITGTGRKKFRDLVSSIPEEERAAVVASALNGVFVSGRGRERQLSAKSLAAWWADLKRSPSAMKEMSEIFPEGGVERLGHMAELAEGLARLQDSSVKTGYTQTVLTDLANQDHPINRLRKVSGLGYLSSAPGVETMSRRLFFVGRSLMASKDEVTDAVDGLMASPAFKKYLYASATNPEGRATRNLERALKGSGAFKKYAKGINNEEFKRATGAGWVTPAALVAYMLGREEEED